MANSENRSLEIPQSQLMEDAKNALSGQWGLAVAAYLIVFAVSIAANFIPLLSFLVGGPLALGVAIFALRIARGQKAEISNIFDGFQNFGAAIGTYLLMMLAIIIGTICFIVPGIILAFGLSQCLFLLADDPDIGPVNALKKSWEIMDGHKMDYFVLSLRFIPWVFLCIFTLGIGFLWLGPYMQVTFANFYQALRYGDQEEDAFDDISKHLVD